MNHETAVLLARACNDLEADLIAAVQMGDEKAILDVAIGIASLKHVVKYVFEGEEKYGRS